MSHCRVKPAVSRSLSFGVVVVFCLNLVLLLALTLSSAGCGAGSDEELVVAAIGDYEVTKGYYERKLAKLKKNELPRDEAGEFADTGTLEGRKAFLKSIINKELMAKKAEQLGYLNDPEVAIAHKTMREYQASNFLHEDKINANAMTVSEEEAEAYYAGYKTQRRCSFLITNFLDDAVKARQEIVDGALWNDVAAKFHDGYEPPDGNYVFNIQWGRYEDSFEEAVFTLEIGEMTPPVETVYGWWILRYDEQVSDRIPPLAEVKTNVLNSIRTKRINLARKAYVAECRERYDYKLDEDALWIAFQGLPAGERIMNPETGKPYSHEFLKPLEIPVDELDRVFYEYTDLEGEHHVTTIGDYKIIFDKASVFVRPKASEMLGGMRQKLDEAGAKTMLSMECYRLNYVEDPRVEEAVKDNVERMMVSKLYADIIRIDEHVGPDVLHATYVETKEQFFVPETRTGRIVYCDSESSCREAWQKAAAGNAWEDLLSEFDTNPKNQEADGVTPGIRDDSTSPLRDVFFALEAIGELSEPFQIGEKWAVATLTVIKASYQPLEADIRGDLAQIVRSRRKDEMLNGLLAEWQQEFPVSINDDALNQTSSWEELKGAQTPAARGLKEI